MSSDPQGPPAHSHSSDHPELAATITAGGAVPSGSGTGRALPASIGGYRILGVLGEGGMGIVYEAEQENPRRRVALKVIRGGHFVDEMRVRMFQREAATLARLRHPNIGAIYEAGRTESGEHFFAMELVQGRDLDSFLRARTGPLDRDEIRFRLRLMVTICAAVHYAHQRGVIHRDLKPTNIVVSNGAAAGSPEVKILDFGLARITESDIEATTAVTEVGIIKGTLPYMSPEQARGDGERIDLRTDVYALGVILYEMLTGRRPYELQRTSIVEAVRVICEQPPAPLTRSWSGVRAPDMDLQVILGRALEKDADRRYGSAEALAEDLQRHLDSRPILARPPSTIYQLRKFAQRNRALVAGVLGTMLALIAGIAATTIFGMREAAARRAAEQAREETQAVAEFQAGMLSGVDAPAMGERLAEDLAKRIAEARRAAGASEPEIAASVASFRTGLGEINVTDAALRVIDEDILARAITVADTQFSARPAIHARLMFSICETYFSLGMLEKAEAAGLAARARYDSLLGPDAADALETRRLLAMIYTNQGRADDAEPLLRSVIEGQQRTLGLGDTRTLRSMDYLGVLYTDMRRLAEAESLYAIALPAQTRSAGEDDPFTLNLMHNYGWTLTEAEKYPRAESLLTRTLAARRRIHGNQSAITMGTANNLAVLYRRTRRNELAEPLMREDYETSRRLLGDEHPDLLVTMTNLGRLYNDLERYRDAEAILAKSLASHRRMLPPGFIGTGVTMLAHGEALLGLDRLREAEPELREAHQMLRAARGDDDPGVRRAADRLAQVYEKTGRTALAKQWRERGSRKS